MAEASHILLKGDGEDVRERLEKIKKEERKWNCFAKSVLTKKI